MNLESIFGKKPKTEISTEIKETQPEKLSYKRFLKKEYLYLVPIVFGLSGNEQAKTKEDTISKEYKQIVDNRYDEFTNLPENIDLEEARKILYDFEEILVDEANLKYLINDLDIGGDFEKDFFDTFSKEELRNRLREVGGYLLIREGDIYMMQRDSTYVTKVYDKAIDEFIQKTSLKPISERKYYQPELSEFLFETYDDEVSGVVETSSYRDMLKNSEGRKRAQECDASIYSDEALEEIASNDQLYNFLKKLRTEFDVHVDDDFISDLSNPTLGNTKYSVNFLDITSNQNKQILEQSKGELLSKIAIQNILTDTKHEIGSFFSDPQNKENLEKLKSLKITTNSLLSLTENDPETLARHLEILKSPHFISLLEKFGVGDPENSENVDFEFFFKSIKIFLGKKGKLNEEYPPLYKYYNLETKEGCDQFFSNYKKVTNFSPNLWFGEKIGLFDKISVLEDLYNNIDSENPEPQAEKFLDDPALEYVIKLGYDKQAPQFLDGLSKRMKSEWIMRVSRNMFVSGVEPTEENFKEYFKETVLLRSNLEMTKMKVFEDRNVVCLSHNEKWQQNSGEYTGKNRFMSDSLVSVLKANNPSEMIIFRGKEDKKSLLEAKDNFLDYIRNHEKITVFMNGHGDPNDFYLSEGSVDNGIVNSNGSITINYTELAKAFKDRENKGLHEQSILILEACSNQNFVRNLYQELEKNGVERLPIIIGSSEFGQYGFTDNKDYSSKFFKEVFQGNKSDVKIQDFIDVEQKNTNAVDKLLITNPTIFFPIQIKDEKGKKKDIHWQIAESKYLEQQSKDNEGNA